MTTKKRKARPTAVGDVLQGLLQNGKSPLSQQFTRWHLWQKWPEIVGKTISEQTDPVGYEKGVLFVWVKNSAWMQDLIFHVHPIKEQINNYLGRRWVKRIRFTLDRKMVPSRSESDEDLKAYLAKVPPSADGEPPHDR